MLTKNFGGYKSTISLTTIVTLALVLSDNCAQAQIASDSTTNTKVQVIDSNNFIEGGIVNGQNLFHSFKQFSLTTNEIANFAHGSEIQNIFSRVTGGKVSDIDGLIQTQGDASLFLLNPAGVIFGANAQLDIGGSFLVSTGDRFIFADGSEFGTTNLSQDSLLTISTPVGLQYGINPGKVEILSNTSRLSSDSSGLSIKAGETLALLGGDVSITRNSLNGSSSNIEIGSIKSGKVALGSHDNGWQFNYDQVKQTGTIDLSNRALIINSSGVNSFYGATVNLAEGSGIINFINANETESLIKLEATRSINLNNSSLLSQVWQQRFNTSQNNTGAGGDIYVKAPEISFSNGSLISAATLGEEAGGNIVIKGSESLKLYSDQGENPTIISTSTEGAGNGGDIEIKTTQFMIADGSQIQAFGREGTGGEIKVDAQDSINITGTGILRSQDPITGELSETTLASGLSASAGIEGIPADQQFQGDSGNLIINTPLLNLDQSGQISVSNFGLGNGGNIQINTIDLDLNNFSKINANTVSGNGGSIEIKSRDLVTLNQQSAISTSAVNQGNGGKINVETKNLVLLKSNQISANAQQGSGGKIKIDTQVLLADQNSSITADSEVNQKKGVVEIETLDLNSRLQTKREERSPLTAENYIQKGCGAKTNSDHNQFRNIGRGGISRNLTQEAKSVETIADLDNDTQIVTKNPFQTSNPQIGNKKAHTVTEAHQWILNVHGNVELIAAKSRQLAISQAKCLNQ